MTCCSQAVLRELEIQLFVPRMSTAVSTRGHVPEHSCDSVAALGGNADVGTTTLPGGSAGVGGVRTPGAASQKRADGSSVAGHVASGPAVFQGRPPCPVPQEDVWVEGQGLWRGGGGPG